MATTSTFSNLLIGVQVDNAAPTTASQGEYVDDSNNQPTAATVTVSFNDNAGGDTVDVVVWGKLKATTLKWVSVDSQNGVQALGGKHKVFSIANPEAYSRLYVQATFGTGSLGDTLDAQLIRVTE